MKAQITDIKPNPNNPRTISESKFQQLVDSMIAFPQMLDKRPLICYTDADGKYVVLGGNMRLKAAQQIGITELPIVLADDWSPEQRDEFLIKDNVSFGSWDMDALGENFDIALLTDWGFEFPDFKEAEAMIADKDYFDDPGLHAKSQYGVIVLCDNEQDQESKFKQLTDAGHNCKIVVT